MIQAFFKVYNTLGFGFFEHIYATALAQELIRAGHSVAREVAVEVFYEDVSVGTQRIDMIVDDVVVVEIKSTIKVPAHSSRQTVSYLKSTRLEVGLLLHFGPEPSFERYISSQLPRAIRGTRLITQD